MYRVSEIQLEDETLITAISPAELALHQGDQCIVECNRILEYGTIVALSQREGDMPGRNGHFVVLRDRKSVV